MIYEKPYNYEKWLEQHTIDGVVSTLSILQQYESVNLQFLNDINSKAAFEYFENAHLYVGYYLQEIDKNENLTSVK